MATINMKTLKFANDTNTYKVVDGDALHTLNDMANKSKGSWDGNTLPPDIPNGVTYVECSNNSDTMNFPSNYGICISINSSTYRQTQIFITKEIGRMWVRSMKDETTWGNWQLVYNSATVFYSSSQPANTAPVGSLWLKPVS